MTMKKLTFVALALATTLLSSCVVGRKKFEQSENARWRAYYSRDSLAALLDDSRAQYAALDQRCGMLMNDTALLKKSIRNYQSMLANNQSENKKLNSSLAQKIIGRPRICFYLAQPALPLALQHRLPLQPLGSRQAENQASHEKRPPCTGKPFDVGALRTFRDFCLLLEHPVDI